MVLLFDSNFAIRFLKSSTSIAFSKLNEPILVRQSDDKYAPEFKAFPKSFAIARM